VAVPQGTLEVTRPITPAIRASYRGACLDSDVYDVRVAWRKCYGLDVGCVRFLGGREPQAAGADATESVKLRPVCTAVPRDEDERRLRASIHGAGFRTANCEGLDDVPLESRRTPRPSAVIRAQYAASLRPGVDHLWVQRVRCQAAYVLIPEQKLDRPFIAREARSAHDSIPRRGYENVGAHQILTHPTKVSGSKKEPGEIPRP